MSESDISHPPLEAAEVVVRRRRGIPVVWIIPLLAAALGGWLWWQAAQERGPTIAIRFQTAEGLEAGKTKVKFKDVEVGQVVRIQMNPDFTGVTVTAEMQRAAEGLLLASSRFWVVRPRIGAGGISGLGTLIAGAHIALDPGSTGAPATSFVGLEEPPLTPADAPGLKIVLQSDTLGSVDVATTITYRQIEVGRIERYHFDAATEQVLLDAYIEPQYSSFVRENTRFWNASGIEVDLGASGLRVSTESLEAVLLGGISFGLPQHEAAGPPAQQGAVFHLFADRQSAQEVYLQRERLILYFHESVRGLTMGAPVEFRGIEVGQVLDVALEHDVRTEEFRVPVVIEMQPERIRLVGGERDMSMDHEHRIGKFVEMGLRAQLASGSLVTGSRYVEFGFHPETSVQLVGADDRYPEIPTIPSQAAALDATLDELPLIVKDLRLAIGGAAGLLGSPDAAATLAAARVSSERLAELLEHGGLQESLADVSGTMGELRKLASELSARAPALLERLEDSTTALSELLASSEAAVDGLALAAPELERQLGRTLAELSASLHSVRGLTEILERHPEALLRGKDTGDD